MGDDRIDLRVIQLIAPEKSAPELKKTDGNARRGTRVSIIYSASRHLGRRRTEAL